MHVLMQTCSLANMFSCKHIVMHVLMQTCSHANMFSCKHVLMQKCSLANMFSCKHVLMHVLMRTCSHACSHAATFPCKHVLMQTSSHVCSHANMFSCNHVSKQTFSQANMFSCKHVLMFYLEVQMNSKRARTYTPMHVITQRYWNISWLALMDKLEIITYTDYTYIYDHYLEAYRLYYTTPITSTDFIDASMNEWMIIKEIKSELNKCSCGRTKPFDRRWKYSCQCRWDPNHQLPVDPWDKEASLDHH